MKQLINLVLTLSLVGCAAPAVNINLPPDHPAAPAAPEAAYAPTPTPIKEDTRDEASEGSRGGESMSMGGASQMHHHHGGGNQ